MKSYNNVTLVGTAITPAAINGNSLCKFNMNVKTSSGKEIEIPVHATGKLGILCFDYIHPGDLILISGEISNNIFEGLSIEAQSLNVLETKNYE